MAHEGTTTVTRRRLLGGVVALGAGSAASGAGTMAYFTDAGTSQNEVVAGTLTLSYGESGKFSFSTSLGPTETTQDSVTLVNGGSLDGSLDVDVGYTEHDASGGDPPDVSATQVAQNLELTTLTYGGTDLTEQLSPATAPPTLDDLATNSQGTDEQTPNALIDLPDPGTGTDFVVGLRLKNVSDDYQADGVAVEFAFTLNQNDGM